MCRQRVVANESFGYCGSSFFGIPLFYVDYLFSFCSDRTEYNVNQPLKLMTEKQSREGVGGGGVTLGILGGGVPPDSPNPDPISDQKMSISTAVFRPGL